MLIATNKISVTPETRERTLKAFEHAIPGMKQLPGFLGFELWFGDDENVILGVSRWESKEALDNYIKSQTFQHHHSGTPAEQPSGSGGHTGSTLYTSQVLA